MSPGVASKSAVSAGGFQSWAGRVAGRRRKSERKRFFIWGGTLAKPHPLSPSPVPANHPPGEGERDWEVLAFVQHGCRSYVPPLPVGRLGGTGEGDRG